MWELEKATIVTNNNKVAEKFSSMAAIEFVNSYEEVLLKTRDLVYDKHILLTHPQAGSLKPNQTPYRSVIVYPKGEEGNLDSIMMIDKCIQVYNEWQEIAKSPATYDQKVADDFKTIDLSIIENVIPRIV